MPCVCGIRKIIKNIPHVAKTDGPFASFIRSAAPNIFNIPHILRNGNLTILVLWPLFIVVSACVCDALRNLLLCFFFFCSLVHTAQRSHPAQRLPRTVQVSQPLALHRSEHNRKHIHIRAELIQIQCYYPRGEGRVKRGGGYTWSRYLRPPAKRMNNE